MCSPLLREAGILSSIKTCFCFLGLGEAERDGLDRSCLDSSE